jgi:hypothetical protein
MHATEASEKRLKHAISIALDKHSLTAYKTAQTLIKCGLKRCPLYAPAYAPAYAPVNKQPQPYAAEAVADAAVEWGHVTLFFRASVQRAVSRTVLEHVLDVFNDTALIATPSRSCVASMRSSVGSRALSPAPPFNTHSNASNATSASSTSPPPLANDTVLRDVRETDGLNWMKTTNTRKATRATSPRPAYSITSNSPYNKTFDTSNTRSDARSDTSSERRSPSSISPPSICGADASVLKSAGGQMSSHAQASPRQPRGGGGHAGGGGGGGRVSTCSATSTSQEKPFSIASPSSDKSQEAWHRQELVLSSCCCSSEAQASTAAARKRKRTTELVLL